MSYRVIHFESPDNDGWRQHWKEDKATEIGVYDSMDAAKIVVRENAPAGAKMDCFGGCFWSVYDPAAPGYTCGGKTVRGGYVAHHLTIEEVELQTPVDALLRQGSDLLLIYNRRESLEQLHILLSQALGYPEVVD